MNEIQKYDLIKPLGEFKPMGPISHVEIQPVKGGVLPTTKYFAKTYL
jgi:hypothetical protein